MLDRRRRVRLPAHRAAAGEQLQRHHQRRPERDPQRAVAAPAAGRRDPRPLHPDRARRRRAARDRADAGRARRAAGADRRPARRGAHRVRRARHRTHRAAARATAADANGAQDGHWASISVADAPATLQPIMVDGEPYGAIVALAAPDSMSTDDLEALQFAATVAALRQVQARALVEDDRRFQAVCLEELVSGHLTDRSVLSERAAAFGWDLSLPRAVLLAQAESSTGGDADTVRSLADAARSRARAERPSSGSGARRRRRCSRLAARTRRRSRGGRQRSGERPRDACRRPR